MILQISLRKKSDAGFVHELEFSRFPLVFGREDKNDIVLPDPAKIISRKHARIIDTEGILQLMDLGSANFTYLNEEKLRPNEEYAIKSGDVIAIGDYHMEIQLLSKTVTAAPEEDQKTMIFTNPFREDVEVIVENLKLLSAKYSLEKSPLKEDMLKISLGELDLQENNELKTFISTMFSVQLSKPVLHFEPAAGVPRQEYIPKPVPVKEMSIPELHVPEEKYLSSHFTNTVDVLLGTFTKLIQGFLQFRQEFFGITVFHTIPTGSLQEIKQYLFSPENSAEEEKKKLSLLEEETRKLLNHQIGLLEGYRASVMEGSQGFLQSLDPDVVEKEVMAKAKAEGGFNPGKFVPALMKAKVLEVLKDNYRKNVSDPYHIEKRYFRPSFLKGYQTRTSHK